MVTLSSSSSVSKGRRRPAWASEPQLNLIIFFVSTNHLWFVCLNFEMLPVIESSLLSSFVHSLDQRRVSSYNQFLREVHAATWKLHIPSFTSLVCKGRRCSFPHASSADFKMFLIGAMLHLRREDVARHVVVQKQREGATESQNRLGLCWRCYIQHCHCDCCLNRGKKQQKNQTNLPLWKVLATPLCPSPSLPLRNISTTRGLKCVLQSASAACLKLSMASGLCWVWGGNPGIHIEHQALSMQLSCRKTDGSPCRLFDVFENIWLIETTDEPNWLKSTFG